MSLSFKRAQGRLSPAFAAYAVVVLLLGGCCAAFGQSGVGDPTGDMRVIRDGVAVFERDVNRALRVNPDQPAPATTTKYDFAKYAHDYFVSALSPENLISGVAASATGAAFHSALHDFSTDSFQSHLAENLTRKGIAGSIDFLTASLLQQDVRFLPSGAHGFRTRLRYAFLQTFIDRGRAGNEIAVPRLAASFGTAWVLETWHPWMKTEPNLWSHAGFILGSYAARSIWTEFKPDIKHEMHAFLRHDSALTRQ